MRWVFCHVTVQYNSVVLTAPSGEETSDISDYTPVYFTEYASPPLPLTFSEETVAKNMKGDSLSSVTLIALHSEVNREEKRKKWK